MSLKLMALYLCLALNNLELAVSRRSGLVLLPPEAQPLDQQVEDEWFSQMLDHFDLTNTRNWQQRYFTNDEYYSNSSNSPVFLMISGENAASSIWMNYGAWITYAKEQNALLFMLEHRYYGLSRPTQDLSRRNLRYLSSEQALADIANFIQGMNSKYSLRGSNKWIMIGGSYAGSLAAWARLKYPHLVYGAVSSSGPLEAILDFKDYSNVVEKSLRTFKGCSKAVHKSALNLVNLLKSKSGTKELIDKLNICSGFDRKNKNDVANFLSEILSNPISSSVQYNGVAGNINDTCVIMTNSSMTPIDRIVELNGGIKQGNCNNVGYKSNINEYKIIDWNSSVIANGEKQWLYQTCAEFGFFQTSSTMNDLYSSTVPLSYFTDLCFDVFGHNFALENEEGNINRTNIMYGSKQIQVTRVVFVQGSIDPWHALGITSTPYPQAPAIFIKGTSHCEDMYNTRSSDPPQLLAARDKIGRILKTWLHRNSLDTSVRPQQRISPHEKHLI